MNYPYVSPGNGASWPIFKTPATATTPEITYYPVQRPAAQQPPPTAPAPVVAPAAAPVVSSPPPILHPVQILPYYDNRSIPGSPQSPKSNKSYMSGHSAHSRHCFCDECKDYRQTIDEIRQEKKKRIDDEERSLLRELEKQRTKNEIDRLLQEKEDRRLALSLASSANRHHHHHHDRHHHARTSSNSSMQAVLAELEKLKMENQARQRHEEKLALAKKYKDQGAEVVNKTKEEYQKQLQAKEKQIQEKENQLRMARMDYDLSIDKLFDEFLKETKDREEKDKEKERDKKKGKEKEKEKEKDKNNNNHHHECRACKLLARLNDTEYHRHYPHHD